jgi:hypothetical protein
VEINATAPIVTRTIDKIKTIFAVNKPIPIDAITIEVVITIKIRLR